MSVDRRWTSPLAGAIGSASRCPCRGDMGSRIHPEASLPARRRPSLRLTHLGTRARLKGHGPSDAPSAPESRGGRRNRSKVLGVAGQYAKLGGLVTQPYDADYWRRRANEARALAEAMTLPVARRALEHIAATYERLANRAECLAGRKGTRERS